MKDWRINAVLTAGETRHQETRNVLKRMHLTSHSGDQRSSAMDLLEVCEAGFYPRVTINPILEI